MASLDPLSSFVRRMAGAGAIASLVTLVGCGKPDEEGRPGPPDTYVPPDSPPTLELSPIPIFGGVSRARVTVDGIVLEWFAGVDDETATDDLVYVAYAGRGNGPVNLAEPVGVSLPGAESLLLVGLEPADYRFVVRVRDEDENEDDNIASVRISTLEETPPEFSGVNGVAPSGPVSMLIDWEPASDDTTPSHQLRYRIYTGEEPDAVFSDGPVLETEPGALSAVWTIEQSWARNWVGVRAVDAAGNEDENDRVTSIFSPENSPPSFGGLVSAGVTHTGVLLSWSPARDNDTAARDIRYEVYYAKSPGAQDLSRPNLVTDAGVVQVIVADLDPGSDYYFIVRAIDEAGNRDSNVVQVSAETKETDATPPMFSGVTSVESHSPTSLRAAWDAASDGGTDPARMRYEVFVTPGSDPPDLDNPTWITPPGRLEAEILGLAPGTSYSVVVRALDEGGNVSAFSVAGSGSTLDATGDDGPPILAGDVDADLVPSDAGVLLVSWMGATDETSSAQGVRGHVCVGASSEDCKGEAFYDNYNVSSAYGASSVFVSGLTPRTTYSIGVRLEDEGGNYTSSIYEATGDTATSFSSNVEPILTVRCNQCHEAHVFTYGTLVTVPSSDQYEEPENSPLYLVDPSNVTRSYLLRKLRPQGDVEAPFSAENPAGYLGERMPSDESWYLTPEVEQVLVDWIAQGAFLN